MRIVHISDTHGAKYHEKLQIPECDVLIHSGDIGGRTNNIELAAFLIWMSKQPARKKIYVAGNHDICMDKKFINKASDYITRMLMEQSHTSAMDLFNHHDIKYLFNESYTWESINFYGSPYSPSFHRDYWAFNADRGNEIKSIWGRIPDDTDVLITHGPPYGMLDRVEEKYKDPNEDPHVGCHDLLDIIKTKLISLKLHCFGHIHDNVGCITKRVSATRRVKFSNGAVIDNAGNQLITKPLIINL